MLVPRHFYRHESASCDSCRSIHTSQFRSAMVLCISNEQVYQRKGITTIANLFSCCDFDRLYRAFILLCAPQIGRSDNASYLL